MDTRGREPLIPGPGELRESPLVCFEVKQSLPLRKKNPNNRVSINCLLTRLNNPNYLHGVELGSKNH